MAGLFGTVIAAYPSEERIRFGMLAESLLEQVWYLLTGQNEDEKEALGAQCTPSDKGVDLCHQPVGERVPRRRCQLFEQSQKETRVPSFLP